MSTPPSPDNAVAAHGCFAAAGAGQTAAGEGVQTLYVLRHGGDKDRVAARAFVIPGLHVQHGGRAMTVMTAQMTDRIIRRLFSSFSFIRSIMFSSAFFW